MNRRGFKWKTLINDIKTGSRYQIMQMARPVDFQNSSSVISEPLSLKAAQLYSFGKELVEKQSNKSQNGPAVDIPYCFFSALQQIKRERKIDKFSKLNPDNVITAQMDILPPLFMFDGVKNRAS